MGSYKKGYRTAADSGYSERDIVHTEEGREEGSCSRSRVKYGGSFVLDVIS